MSKEQVAGGAVAVVALIGETQILLIRELSKPPPIFWKLISETAKEGETPIHAAVSGLREEAGLEDLKPRVENGNVVGIDDPRIKRFIELGEPTFLPTRLPHYRHFFGALATDEVVHSLSGQILHIDEDEIIETQAFPLASLDMLSSGHKLLRQHAELILSIPHRVGALSPA